MKTRKIQQVGSGTVSVSIPADWADEHDIEAGTTAYLYTHRDGSLVVRWNEKELCDLGTTAVELADGDPAVAPRWLLSAYAAGFSTIRLHAPAGLADAQQRAIHTRARDLTGVEVTDESADTVVVRDLLNTSDVSVRQATMELKYVPLSMVESALNCLTDGTDCRHIVDRDDDADRLFWLLTRHLNRSLQNMVELDQLGLTRSELFTYFAMARQLERIGEHTDRVHLPEKFVFVFVLMFVMAFGVAWEVFEFASSRIGTAIVGSTVSRWGRYGSPNEIERV